MLKETAVQNGIDRAFDSVEEQAKGHKKVIKVNKSQIENSLKLHIAKVINWSKEIGFKDMEGPKSIFNTYIPLDFYFNPIKTRVNSLKKDVNKFPLESLFKSTNNIVILGQPGAGKSTTMKYLCQKLLVDENFLNDTYSFPLLMRFRELKDITSKFNEAEIIISYLYNEFGLIIENSELITKYDLNEFKKLAVFTFLAELRPLIIFDGLDEIPAKITRDRLLKELEEISLKLTSCKYVLTSRSGDYDFYLTNTRAYEISPLSDDQILEFSTKWLQNEEKAKELCSQLKISPYYDTTIRPLTLAHLCVIFEREGEIPKKPKTVYQKIVQLLIQEWNIQNRINRDSAFSNFEPERKRDFLSNLAYELTAVYSRSNFDTTDLYKCYQALHIKFELPLDQADLVIKEIETDNGLIIQSSFNTYEFAHKSLQEFLAAEHVVKMPTLPMQDTLIFKMPNEMALAVALSSEPTEYFCFLITERLIHFELNFGFIKNFMSRLSIEKPEFTQSNYLGVCFLNLFSTYINNLFELGERPKKLSNESAIAALVDDFALLLKIEAMKKSLQLFREQYIEEESFQITNNKKVYFFIILSNKNKMNGRTDQNIFPEQLTISKQFLV